MPHYLRFLTVFFIIIAIKLPAQNVGIGNTGGTPHASAVLDLQSTTKGFLIPRMTTTERNAIAAPATGLLVYDNTTSSFWFRKTSTWQEMLDISNSPWLEDGSLNVRTRNGGDVSITPGSPLGFGKLNVVAQSTLTNTNESIIQVIRSTTGTAAAGLSGSIDFYNENSSGGFPPTARIVCESMNTTVGNHAASLEFFTSGSGVLSSQLYLSPSGVGIGTSIPSIFSKLDVNGSININGKITRSSSTGLVNLIPLCYGSIDAAGNIISGTGNFTVSKIATGFYAISNASLDANCIVSVTSRSVDLNNLAVRMYTTTFHDGDWYVISANSSAQAADCGFHFTVYKP
jgi:hypothetical protein